MNAPLTIYKASAGSGKTFRLTVEYISLLIRDPESYRHILAVTFTNKATAEMKIRILSQLYGIARGLKSSDGYLAEVRKNVFFTDEELAGRKKDDVIRQRAAIALSLLSHHYGDFRVLTIDSFFQIVLRNLAHELDLSANLRISLNDEDIEADAVDNMVESLHPNDKELKWITDFIQSKMDENQSWQVMKDIKAFGLSIFKEFYQSHSKELNERLLSEGFFERFVQSMRTLKSTSLAAIIKPYQTMLNLIVAENLDGTQWFADKAASCDLAYIRKMIDIEQQSKGDVTKMLAAPTGSNRQKRIDDPKKWVNGKNKKTPECQHLIELAASDLCSMMAEAEENRHRQARNYLSAEMTLKFINQLRLLHAIERAVDGLNADEGRFLLSNTQHLLNTMIDGSDTPFIFEKIGAQLRHIMIDEFQDTSTVQWQNFRVLLENCLAQRGSHSLIVGDVKQSIYRWRSGDWTLLNNMQESETVHIEPIKDNWRSSQDIVNFNNAFFLSAKNKERDALAAMGISQADQLALAYNDDDTPQKPRKTFPGHVQMLLFKKGERSKEQTEIMRSRMFAAMDEHICRLLDSGVASEDIAILARGKNDIQQTADHFAHSEELQQRGAQLVSDEAFRLEACVSVRIIIRALRLIAHPEDVLAKAELTKNYQTYILGSTLDECELLAGTNIDTYLPDGFIDQLEQLAKKPLLDLVDHLYQLFSLHRLAGQTAYVCSFHDHLAKYLEDHVTDIDGLMQYWDEKLCKEKVQAADVAGIRIMTIHKSKGLEFKHVIIPFCDWALEKPNTIFWCEKEHPAPFGALPLIPVEFSSKMLHTVYAEDYKEEHFQNVVDNLNMLYVAFTRAERSLLVLAERSCNPKNADSGKGCRSYLIEQVLNDLAREDSPLQGATLEEDDERLTYDYGSDIFEGESKISDVTEEPAVSENVFEQKPKTLTIPVETFKTTAQFRQSNRSHDFISDTADSSSYIRRGNLLHEIFSHIRTLDDVEPAIAQLTLDGIIANDEKTLADLRSQIAQCLNQDEAREWFDTRWTLFNECTILTVDPDTGLTVEHRPDRVMKDEKETVVVDFKFGHPRPEYKEQVRQYIGLLQDMGEKNVSGYLWYVTDGKIERVEKK